MHFYCTLHVAYHPITLYLKLGKLQLHQTGVARQSMWNMYVPCIGDQVSLYTLWRIHIISVAHKSTIILVHHSKVKAHTASILAHFSLLSHTRLPICGRTRPALQTSAPIGGIKHAAHDRRRTRIFLNMLALAYRLSTCVIEEHNCCELHALYLTSPAVP